MDGFTFHPNGMVGVGRIRSRIQKVEENGTRDYDSGVRFHDASLSYPLFDDRVSLSDPVLA